MDHFADRLTAAIISKGTPICVGIDPVHERLPASIRAADGEGAKARVAAIERYVQGVLKAVAPHVPVVKFQSACFERYLWMGVESLRRLMAEARGMGLIVINDAKRGDIGISSEHYANGCLADSTFADLPRSGADALTVSPYLGADGIEPFVKLARGEGKGLFALVRTSNPGGDALQSLKLADGRSVAEAVAQLMASAGAADVGRCGYSLLGAVVGATKASDAARLRELMPQQVFLVPGFGAQGGSADDVRACFKKDGSGAIITASRSVLFAYEKPATEDWTGAIESAAVRMRQEIAAIVG